MLEEDMLTILKQKYHLLKNLWFTEKILQRYS